MKVKYIASEDDFDTRETTTLGRTFVRGEEADVSDMDDASRAILAGNPSFEVTEADTPAKAGK